MTLEDRLVAALKPHGFDLDELAMIPDSPIAMQPLMVTKSTVGNIGLIQVPSGIYFDGLTCIARGRLILIESRVFQKLGIGTQREPS
jgi:hypothetical protein